MQDIDQQRIAELAALLGEAPLLALGDQLAAALASLPREPANGIDEVLHRLKGSAASLGFIAIAAELAAARHDAGDLAGLARHAADIVPALAAAIHGSTRQR